MKLYKLTSIILVFTFFSFKNDKVAYQIFDENGKKSNYDKMLKQAEGSDIILFGELHDNPIVHWLQLELTEDIFEKAQENLVLGAEMFEADNQLIINEFLGGHFSYDSFKKEAKIWPNNKTAYQPLLDFALANQLTFVGTNIPRRYASMVNKEGFKAFNHLSEDAKKYIAPLPITYDEKLPGYANMLEMEGDHVSENLPKSQAAKDATMAHFILKNWSKGKIFIHYNGSYHSDNFEGIVWYLKKSNPELKIMTISNVEQVKIDTLLVESKNLANYIIVTPELMTKTH